MVRVLMGTGVGQGVFELGDDGGCELKVFVMRACMQVCDVVAGAGW